MFFPVCRLQALSDSGNHFPHTAQTDSVVLPKGIVFDVETPEEVAADEAQKKAQQQQEAELQKMIDDDSVIPIDINDLNL